LHTDPGMLGLGLGLAAQVLGVGLGLESCCVICDFLKLQQ